MSDGGDHRPVPDPTTLTTSALNREVRAVRELLDGRIDALDRLVMDKFATTEAHRLEQKDDVARAMNAALAAVQDENAKTEASTTKQIDALKLSMDSALNSVTRELNALTGRVRDAEGEASGRTQARTNFATYVSMAVGLIVIMGFLFAVFAARG